LVNIFLPFETGLLQDLHVVRYLTLSIEFEPIMIFMPTGTAAERQKELGRMRERLGRT
jgi:hypothetical protein